MKTTYVSTATLNGSARGNVAKLQGELVKTNKELTTGVKADIGLDQGVKADASVQLRAQKASLHALITNNTAVSVQLKTAQNALTDLSTNGQSFLNSLLSLSDTTAGIGVLANDARAKVDGLLSTLNVSDGRRFVFGGIKSGEAPMTQYADGPQAAIESAFSTAFAGRTPDDPSISDITPADMQSFLDGAFADEFSDANWSANWSDASDSARTSAISQSETVTTSVSANETAMRKLAMAYTMVAEFGTANLAPETLQVVTQKAREVVGSAMNGLTDLSARLGSAQARITVANDLMSNTSDGLDTKLASFEAVDPAAAKTKVDQLTTQIEMSYSLTSQIMKLSILNYV